MFAIVNRKYICIADRTDGPIPVQPHLPGGLQGAEKKLGPRWRKH